MGLSRRQILRGGGLLAAGALAPGWLLAEELAMLDVASAGSFRAMLDGPVKMAAAKTLKLDVKSHSQGADAVAHALVDGSLRADVFIPITAGPMHTVMDAGKSEIAYPIARTEMVLVYSPKSRFVAQFEAAKAGKTNWWDVLREPELRFARGNPAGDPGGRNAFFVMMLAAKKYGHPDVVERLLGSAEAPAPPGGGSNQEKLQSGELDAAASYKVSASAGSLPFMVLPKDVNLSRDQVREEHPDVSLSIGGKTFYPEPLVFYAAALKGAGNPEGAVAFIEWLKGDEARGVLEKYAYDAPGGTAALKA